MINETAMTLQMSPFSSKMTRRRKEMCPCKSKSSFLGDGKVRELSNVKYYPDPVEHSMEGKKIFLKDGLVRGMPTTPNVIMALLKAPYRR